MLWPKGLLWSLWPGSLLPAGGVFQAVASVRVTWRGEATLWGQKVVRGLRGCGGAGGDWEWAPVIFRGEGNALKLHST